jgi:hypothetical protein
MKVYNLPIGPSGCGNTRLISNGVVLSLEFEYFDGSRPLIGTIKFESIVAYRFSAEMHADDYPDDAYDSIWEIVRSGWKEDLRATEPSGINDISNKHHFCVFLSSNGHFEVLADSCCVLDSRSGNLQ